MKKQRQNKIIEIIERYEITTQDALKKRLGDEGIIVTQATLSRDINELDLRKELSSSGAYIYVRTQRSAVQCPPIFRDSVVNIDHALNTVVIKCHTGMAQAVCALLDKMDCLEIVGTIAGDDTIFALMRSESAACEFADLLKEMILLK
ncbi:MAG: ArgR family transcriptional regulator [Oscillospiraceae bacterium]|nr:ArgR family transcriptional regulator [Oscillospiraceae bacterium]